MAAQIIQLKGKNILICSFLLFISVLWISFYEFVVKKFIKKKDD